MSFFNPTGFLMVLRDNKSIKIDVHVEWMCAVAGFLFSDKNGKLLENLSENNFSWKILSEGLTSVDSLVKKKSLYLLKRWTDHIFRYSNLHKLLICYVHHVSHQWRFRNIWQPCTNRRCTSASNTKTMLGNFFRVNARPHWC